MQTGKGKGSELYGTVNVHMTVPPPGVPFSTTFIAPNSEMTTLSQRVDIPMMCLTFDVEEPAATRAQGPESEQGNDGDDVDDVFVLDDETGLPMYLGPSNTPAANEAMAASGPGSSTPGASHNNNNTHHNASVSSLATSLQSDGTLAGGADTTSSSATATRRGSKETAAAKARRNAELAATPKAIRGLKAPFAVQSDPTQSTLSLTLPASDVALRLTAFDWLTRGEALRKAAKDPESSAIEPNLPPKPTTEVGRQDYEPRPWDWERLFDLSVMQGEMLDVGLSRLQLVFPEGSGGSGASGAQPCGVFLPSVISCGLHALDIGAYNSLIQLYKDKQKRLYGRRLARLTQGTREQEEEASTAVGQLLQSAQRFQDNFDEMDLLPKLRALGTLTARVDSGGVFFEFRDVRKVVADLAVYDDLGSDCDSDEERAAEERARASDGQAAGDGGNGVASPGSVAVPGGGGGGGAAGTPTHGGSVGGGSTAHSTPLAQAKKGGTTGTSTAPRPTSGRKVSVISSSESGGAGAGAPPGENNAEDPRFPNFATIEPLFLHTDSFWRLAAVAGASGKQSMYTRALKRIPLFRLPDGVAAEDDGAAATSKSGPALSVESSPLDPSQVFGTCEYGSLLSVVSRRLYLEKRGTVALNSRRALKGKKPRPPPQWRLQIDTLVLRRLVQLSLAAVEVEVHALNAGLLFQARHVKSNDQPMPTAPGAAAAAGAGAGAGAPQRRPPGRVKPWELLLTPSRCRMIVSAAVTKSHDDPRKMGVLHNAMAVAEASRLDDPVLVVIPRPREGTGGPGTKTKAGRSDVGELHIEDGKQGHIIDTIVDVLMQPRMTVRMCTLMMQEFVLLDAKDTPVRGCCACCGSRVLRVTRLYVECVCSRLLGRVDCVICVAQILDLDGVTDPTTVKLRTNLHQSSRYVPVAIRSSTRRSDQRRGFTLPMLIGSIEVDEWTTLEEARWIIARELDKVTTGTDGLPRLSCRQCWSHHLS